MAYNAQVTIEQRGPGEFSIRIVETDCGPLDEATVDVPAPADGPGAPLVGKVVRQTCVLQAGSGTTINPILRGVPAADPEADVKVLVENNPDVQPVPDIVDTAGFAPYDEVEVSPLGPWARLYHQSRPDAGADNTIVTIYRIASQRW